jgi:putative Ca2+/H+ antiporter (TMEM165/GDT1 family)
MEAFLVSIGVVALAEIGDKTQLLALVLAAQFRRPWPIIAGIFCATLANHALAGLAGTYITEFLTGTWMRWILGLSFIAMAGWALIPDTLSKTAAGPAERYGAFPATVVAFFFIEIGDKTQIATVALAAQYRALVDVVAGTTIGMLLANVPVVLVGEAAAMRLPLKPIRIAAASLFAILGVMTLFDLGMPF